MHYIMQALGDRQFCDLNQTEAFTQDGDHFLVRYHPKTHFCADPSRQCSGAPGGTKAHAGQAGAVAGTVA